MDGKLNWASQWTRDASCNRDLAFPETLGSKEGWVSKAGRHELHAHFLGTYATERNMRAFKPVCTDDLRTNSPRLVQAINKPVRVNPCHNLTIISDNSATGSNSKDESLDFYKPTCFVREIVGKPQLNLRCAANNGHGHMQNQVSHSSPDLIET